MSSEGEERRECFVAVCCLVVVGVMSGWTE